ncbi:MAG: hypothetical protein WCO00_07215 [Rhodospirillaceae bacterium]
MPEQPPDRPSPWLPPMPPTTRRAEVEQARRTRPVQTYRAQLRDAGDDEAVVKVIAEALRKLLRPK